MLNKITASSKRRISRLNQRQRKKLFVGKFQQMLVEIKVKFTNNSDQDSYDQFFDIYLEFIEKNHFYTLGLNAVANGVAESVVFPRLKDKKGNFVSKAGSATVEDLELVRNWLLGRTEIDSILIFRLIDSNYINI